MAFVDIGNETKVLSQQFRETLEEITSDLEIVRAYADRIDDALDSNSTQAVYSEIDEDLINVIHDLSDGVISLSHIWVLIRYNANIAAKNLLGPELENADAFQEEE